MKDENKQKLNKIPQSVKATTTEKQLGGQNAVEEKRVRKLVKAALRSETMNNPCTLGKWNAHVNQFLSGLTLPRDYTVPRLPNGADPTAIANPWARYDANFPAAAAGLPQRFNESPAFVFRDALRFFVSIVSLVSQAVYTGTFSITTVGASESFPNFTSEGGCLSASTTDRPHGDRIYPGRIGPADNFRGWLCNNGDSFQIVINTALYPALQVLYAHVKVLNNGQWQDVSLFQYGGSTGIVAQAFTTPKTGYYAVAFSYSGNALIANAGTLNIYVGGAGQSVFGQKTLPSFSTNYSFIDSLRIVGASLMYTNTASPLNRQGQILGLQVPKGSSWIQWTDFGGLAADKKTVIMDVLNGMYGFLKPTSADDLNMQVYELPDDNAAQNVGNDMVFDLYPKSDFLVVVPQVTIAGGQSGYWTVGAAVEFTTMNQWIELHTSALTHEQLESALDFLSQVPQWHTNSLHWDDIWGAIKDAARDTWSMVKEIAPIAVAAAPLLL